MKKDALTHKEEICKRIERAGDAVVMLDFDGTLAAFKPKPSQVRMRARMRDALAMCARRFPTAIVTGRAISAVRKHVPIRNISYAGNHGLEWRIKGAHNAVVMSAAFVRARTRARKTLTAFAKQNHGTWLEDKKLSLSFHYRGVRLSQKKRVVREVHRLTRAAGGPRLRIVAGEFVLNVLPHIKYDKGVAARMIVERVAREGSAVPIFIGDDVTDEDAFRALRRGVTIHVKNGRRARTDAHYSLKNVASVEKFLRFLSSV